MKAEFLDERDANGNSINNIRTPTTAGATTNHFSIHPDTTSAAAVAAAANMFAKFQPQKFQTSLHHPHPQYHHRNNNHQHSLSQFHFTEDPPQPPQQTSDETDPTTTTTTPTTSTTTKQHPPPHKKPKHSTQIITTTTNSDGETIEPIRKPRGRPPGSKNKPKPPQIQITSPNTLTPSMSPYIIEIQSNSDIITSLTSLSRRRRIGLCILTASGSVTNFAIRQPSSSNGTPTALSFQGRFEMLSLSAVILNPNEHQQQQQHSMCSGVFTIALAGPQGQVVGGKVVGPLIAAGTVYVVAASFCEPSYHRLSGDGEEVEEEEESESGGGGERQVSSGGGGGGMYSSGGGRPSSSSDVVWAPTARVPPPPPQQQQQQPPHQLHPQY